MRVNKKGNCGDSGVFVKADPHYKSVATEAPKRASSNVSLHKRGDRWLVQEYSDRHRAYFQASEYDYWRARELRRVAVARQALEFFFSADEADYLACTLEGSARDVVRKALRRQSQI